MSLLPEFEDNLNYPQLGNNALAALIGPIVQTVVQNAMAPFIVTVNQCNSIKSNCESIKSNCESIKSNCESTSN